MNQLGFLNFDIRLHRIDKAGDPLSKLNEGVNWEIFRPTLERVRKKERRTMLVSKAMIVFCCSRFWFCNLCIVCPMRQWSFQILDR